VIKQPYISVIIPVHNGEKFLEECLQALTSTSYREFELIVVDDCSTDRSVEICEKLGARVLRMSSQSGPGAARNQGVRHACGKIVFFVDSDVVVKRDTFELLVESFTDNPGIAAVFGSYDDEPAEKNFISQYKNLFHCFVHQQSLSEAETFWAGCGAVRRDMFLDLGGFDAERYPRPAIEDIEFDCRLRSKGYRILLNKKLQAKHLKRWTLKSMLQADIFQRAVPWSMLIFERKGLVNDLNLRTSDRVSAGILGLSVGLLPFSLLKSQLLILSASLIAIIPILNYKLYSFFFKRRGLAFAIRAFPLHLLYYLYSSVTFVLCWVAYHLGQLQVIR